jgi:hypothetical protein
MAFSLTRVQSSFAVVYTDLRIAGPDITNPRFDADRSIDVLALRRPHRPRHPCVPLSLEVRALSCAPRRMGRMALATSGQKSAARKAKVAQRFQADLACPDRR